MTNNDILRRLRYALDISNPGMISIFKLSGHVVEKSALDGLLKKEDEPGYLECSNTHIGGFLDGLISNRRGAREPLAGAAVDAGAARTNNEILKKLRIALELKDDEMRAIMELAGVTVSKSELNALFRNKSHKNYKECGDQFLRNFLKGLAIRNRKPAPHSG